MVALPLPKPDSGKPLPRKAIELLEQGRTGRTADVERQIESLAQQSPRDSVARAHILWAIAAYFDMAARHEESLSYIRQAVEALPDDPQLLVALGVILGRLERYEEAVAAIDRALAIDDEPSIATARREVLDAQLHKLAKRGVISWSGGKPRGSRLDIELTPGPNISEWIIDSRR